LKPKIGIIGCGWLGFPLAQTLIEEGYQVNGSTTSAAKLTILNKAGINAYHIHLSAAKVSGDIQGFLAEVHILIVNVPPRLRHGNGESYVAKMKRLLAEINRSKVTKVIFASSTSVYGDIDGNVTEDTHPNPVTESGRQLLETEALFTQAPNFDTTVVRFGGLIGPGRHPIKNITGKKLRSNGNAPVNLIHLTDCIRICTAILTHNYWGELFNAVYPDHPKKKDYYAKMAKKAKIQPPHYQQENDKIGKKISSNRLISAKKFKFKMSIIMDFTTKK